MRCVLRVRLSDDEEAEVQRDQRGGGCCAHAVAVIAWMIADSRVAWWLAMDLPS
jgi:hypothetical protein